MFKLSINVYGGIKAVEKSAHPLHQTHGVQKVVCTEARGQPKRKLLKGLCPSTRYADRIHPLSK